MFHRVKTQRWLNGKAVRLAIALLIMSGCGDANTNDDRGYTKAPLESPKVLIRPERGTAMDSLGSPLLPRDTVIPAPAAAAAPTTAQPKR